MTMRKAQNKRTGEISYIDYEEFINAKMHGIKGINKYKICRETESPEEIKFIRW